MFFYTDQQIKVSILRTNCFVSHFLPVKSRVGKLIYCFDSLLKIPSESKSRFQVNLETVIYVPSIEVDIHVSSAEIPM